MNTLSRARRAHAAMAIALGLSMGCSGGGGLGAGCGGLGALPKTPNAVSFPWDQMIEGGAQVRITKPGFDKITSVIPPLIQKQLGGGMCALGEQKLQGGLFHVSICDTNACPNNQKGCPANVVLNSADKKDGIILSMKDGKNPILVANVGMDIDVPIHVNTFLGSCTLEFYTKHYKNSGDTPLHIIADLQMGIDKPTGELSLALSQFQVVDLSLKSSGCGIASSALNVALDFLNSNLGKTLLNLIVNAVKGPLSNLIAGFLPKPPGLAGVINTGAMLASFDAPKSAALETFLVAGGYVSAWQGGLNLGLMTGMNSDRDPTTRQAGLTSEPALCVPARPAPDLGGMPWNLPANPDRPDHMLGVAAEFSGMPDPKDMNGKVQDLAIGLSRTFLDLTGFHIYNSGTLCLAISGGALAALNAGALTVLVPSLANIIENRKGPVAMVLRPETPLKFTIGAGGVDDPLLHVKVDDLRVDFYAFIEERYERIFTLAADLTVGLNLALTSDGKGNPAIQPMISGIDKSSIELRVTNTDLLSEDPKKLAKTLSGLIDIAVGQLMGGIKPFPLPALQGFSLDGLSITRVQTIQDDFLAIYGSLVQRTSAQAEWPAEAWVPEARTEHPVDTTAKVVDVSVPPPDVIRDALARGDLRPGSVPSVTLELGGTGQDLEWSYRIDDGGWMPWSSEWRRTLVDPAFQLQAKHVVEVRARERGDWLSEDPTPAAVEVDIDSEPPELAPRVEHGQLALHGSDNVTPPESLRYSWKTPSGWTEPAARASLSLDEARLATEGGRRPLLVAAYDEAGNRAETTFGLGGSEFHGRNNMPSTGGCGCVVGAGRSASASGDTLAALLGALGLGGLLLRRRRARRAVPALVLLLAATAGLGASGCSCNGTVAPSRCSVDDDCRAHACAVGNIAQCNPDGTCSCSPDTPLGDVGRYASLALRGTTAYVAAYNNTYGDLMIGHVLPPGVITNWEFVDGVPDDAPSDSPLSTIRGGITAKGDDVGRYASIAMTPNGDPVVAYYDLTHASLKFGSFGAIRWSAYTVDGGPGKAVVGGDDIGRFASLTVDKDGRPGIAYYAEVAKGMSGGRESQLRFAQATSADPRSRTDWVVTVVESRALPPADGPDGGAPMMDVLPGGIALFVSSARKPDGAPVIAYYDRSRGNLRYVEYDAGLKAWGMPATLDGEDMKGKKTADVGQYPSVAYADNTAHIAYVDATHDNLLYVNTMTRTPEVVDDGYRPKDEMTKDGLPAPVYHLVGDSSSIQVAAGQVLVAYQDSTVQQLRFAARDPMTGKWTLVNIAGHGSPFKGSYGFYAQNRLSGGAAVLSSYAVNAHADSPEYYVETFAITLGTIM